MAPKIAIVYYSTYGHIRALAKAIQKGVESAGGQADLLQIPETLSPEILSKMHAPAKAEDPVITPADLPKYDGFLFGVPTRYGTQPAQWRAFWDATGGLWAHGELYGKYVGLFVTTGTPGGGQEVTAQNSLSTFAHHGLIFVPLGYKTSFGLLTNLDEIHGGSPWGAGSFAGGDGSRTPSELEIKIAETQGKSFYVTLSRVF